MCKNRHVPKNAEIASYTALIYNQDRVAAVQAWLNSSQNANLSVDGSYGSLTQEAVKSYQKSRGFTKEQSDGLAGSYTLSYMGFTQDGYFNEEKFEHWVNVAVREYGYTRKYAATYYIDAVFSNATNVKPMPVPPETTEKSYIEKSINQVVLGNFTEDTTLLGTAAQVGIGLTGLDVVTDARDIAYDVTNWEWSWGHAGQTVLDAVAFVPVIGAIKYGDEVGTVVKHADEIIDGASTTVKNASMISDDVIEWLGKDAKMITNSNGDKVFISADGKRRIRFDIKHPAQHQNPHSHVEEFIDGEWKKSGPIFPIDTPK